MYSLFEIRKILQISKSGDEKVVDITLSAYSETKERSILILVCNNGYLLLRFVCANLNKPIVRQLCWFDDPKKKIRSLCFDPSGFWLLLITDDAFLYLLPVLPFLERNIKVPTCWKTDNLTEIKLSGQRAALTSVRWWQTLQGQHIAVIGSELGEISFINLINKKEVGGTYINSGILALDILYDESHDTTYLLITGNDHQQWRLLLEEKKSNCYWPFSSDSEICTLPELGNGNDKIPLADEKQNEQRPHRLSKFESGTYLTPQCGGGRNLVSAYNSSSSLLQVLEGDLDQMQLFSYKVPSACENIILSDKLIFITIRNSSSQKFTLKVLSRKFAEISVENTKKKERQNAEIQNFLFSGPIISMYKLTIEHPNKIIEGNQEAPIFDEEASSNNDKVPSSSEKDTKSTSASCPVLDKQDLEGCLLVQNDCVWECRIKLSPKDLFLSLTAVPSDLPLAEKLGVMLGLDLHRLYEVAADNQLSCGKFAQAVHLYQLSKCPQLKRVSNFMGYGYLSELIAYIQVLFSTKGVEIVSADKCHFANIALHCFAHQAKEKLPEKHAINLAFKRFLKENYFYDEEVAAKLLAEQGLYDLIYNFAKVRGQHGLMVETLLSTSGIRKTVDDSTYQALFSSGYETLLLHFSNDEYMRCMTPYHLLQFLAQKPHLLNQHMQHLIGLLPKMNVPLLTRVAYLYDPSRHTALLALRNLASQKRSKRYWSISSATNSTELVDLSNKVDESSTEDDVVKFFMFVLLMLSHKMNKPGFNKKLLHEDVLATSNNFFVNTDFRNSKKYNVPIKYSTLACGQGHVLYIRNATLYAWGKAGSGRLGLEDQGMEYQTPQAVPTFLRLQIKVLEVSCGAMHSMALTDNGVFSWGSSRYGQLGAGDVQQSSQPIIIEQLLDEQIISIMCGQYHSLALTSDGRVYSWGWGIHGQLGHGKAEDLNLPQWIFCLRDICILSISAGQGHTVLLSKNGHVYTFGCGMFGQLGIGSVQKQSLPQRVNIAENIVMVASGFFHVVAVSKENTIFTWGCNPQALRLQAQASRRAKQHIMPQLQNSSVPNQNGSHHSVLTNGTVQQTHLLPKLVDSSSIVDPIVKVSCGSHHTVLISSTGSMYSWGRNSEGQVGNGTRKEQKIPIILILLKGKFILNMACGADFTIAVDSMEKIWGWGQNDSGQLGQKTSQEPVPKTTSSSSSGRVITIRTNRRMITITQPCHHSVLRPFEIVVPTKELKFRAMDSGSFENEYSLLRLLNHKRIQDDKPKLNLLPLSKLDQPPFGPYALHASFKAFHKFCDFTTLLNHCLSFLNYQAAAKLSALEKQYDKAMEFQLKSIVASQASSDDILCTSLDVIRFYAPMLNPENIDLTQKFLSQVILFWIDNKLPVVRLESLFRTYDYLFSYPLCLMLFCDENAHSSDVKVRSFLSLLSAKFCFSIINRVVDGTTDSIHSVHVLDQMKNFTGTSSAMQQIHASDALTAWDESIPSERLWMDILHNMQKSVISHSAIHLTSSDADALAKSLASERFCQRFSNSVSLKSDTFSSNKDFVFFSCGHHYTLQTFKASILPEISLSFQALSNILPKMIKVLVYQYQVEDIITAACPKCVLIQLKNELCI